jgi:rare lipoprotein A
MDCRPLPPAARAATAITIVATLLLAGCGTLRDGGVPTPPAPAPTPAAPSAPRVPPPRDSAPAAPAAPDATPAPADAAPGADPNENTDAPLETGIASWYGKPFHGRRTASGEVYDMHAMTAAHKTLPFSTQALVRNLANGREVVVRINDRGPFRRGRIIDLSRAAARALGIAGLAQVELRLLTPATAAQSQ